MIVAESGDVRLEANETELRVHAPRPAFSWDKKWLTGASWWRTLRELESLSTPDRISYDRISDLLREGYRFPLLFGGWSPLTIVVDAVGSRFRLGRVDVSVQRAGRYVRLENGGPAWLLDDPSWRLLETPVDQVALRRDLAMEANAEIEGELARTEIVYTSDVAKRYATRSGWVEHRHIENWAGTLHSLCGRVGLRDGLPVRLPATGRILSPDQYKGTPEPAVRSAWLGDASRAELLALIACSFVWRGFHVVLPSDTGWMSDCILAVRHGTVTVVWLLDSCGSETLTQVHSNTSRLRQLLPGEYTIGVVVRGACPRMAKEAGAKKGIRVRDRYELANLAAGDVVPLAAVEWALTAKCSSPGEAVEKLRLARMLP